MKNLCFLFGAGLSIPAGTPSTKRLSDAILTGNFDGKRIVRNISGDYSIVRMDDPVVSNQTYDLTSMFALLSNVKALADLYYVSKRESNYEDWYYLADQLQSASSGDYDNPAVYEFAFNLKKRLEDRDIWSLHPQGLGNDRILTVSELACDYIRAVVCLFLNPSNTDLGYLRWIIDSVNDAQVSVKGIFTLNHDLLLEQLFQSEKVNFTDGFEIKKERVGGLHWSSESLFKTDRTVKLVKLHGSIDWRHVDIDNKTYEKPFSADRFTYKDAKDGSPSEVREKPRPLLLIGRHNKIYNYNNFVFEDLHYRFYLSLKESQNLVICGYGFGDKSINSRIANWKKANPNNKLIFIRDSHPFADTVRLGIHRSMPDWEQDSRVSHVSKMAQSVTWSEISQALE